MATEGRGRRFGIWVFGGLASGIAGGLMTLATIRAPAGFRQDDLAFYGAVAGVSAFVCLRLWLTGLSKSGDGWRS